MTNSRTLPSAPARSGPSAPARRHPSSTGVWLLALVLALGSLSCRAVGRTPAVRAVHEGAIAIEVTNEGADDATIYVLYDGGKLKLGVVPGKQRETFELAWLRALEIRFEIVIGDDTTIRTSPRMLAPGDVISVTVPEEFG